jgi:hypothetical protein
MINSQNNPCAEFECRMPNAECRGSFWSYAVPLLVQESYSPANSQQANTENSLCASIVSLSLQTKCSIANSGWMNYRTRIGSMLLVSLWSSLLLLSLSSVESFSSRGAAFSRQRRRGVHVPAQSRMAVVYPSANDDTENTDSDEARSSASSPTNSEKELARELGGYDPYEKFGGRQIDVGDPQIKVKEASRSVTSILKELAAIQQQGPQKYCILGTRHCSYLHQQIIELL